MKDGANANARKRNEGALRNLSTLIALLVALLIGAAAFIYLGAYDVAADKEHYAATAWLLETTRERSVERRARDVEVALPDLEEATLRHEAVIGYEAMCAECHAPPGRDPGSLARGLNPPPSDLARSAERRSAAELFWVTKHGVRMTGMPAWGITHSDDELWLTVALLRHFPEMDGEQYEQLLSEARAAGVEHHHDHDDDEDHEHRHDHDDHEHDAE